MKKFTKMFRVFTLMMAVTLISFTSCSKFDDSSIWEKINGLDAEQKALKEQVELLKAHAAGLHIKSYTVDEATNTWTLTMSDGKIITVTNGTNGENGTNGTNGTNLALESAIQTSVSIKMPVEVDFNVAAKWKLIDKYSNTAAKFVKGTFNGREAIAFYIAPEYGSMSKTPSYTIPLNIDVTKGYFVFAQVTFTYNDGSDPITFQVDAYTETAPTGTLYDFTQIGAGLEYKSIEQIIPITSVTDYDGNVYQVVELGGLYWITSNLRTKHFDDGTAITRADGADAWKALNGAAGYTAWTTTTFPDAEANFPLIGGLYNYAVVNHARYLLTGADMKKWRVATKADFEAMEKECDSYKDLATAITDEVLGGWFRYFVGNNKLGFNGQCIGNIDDQGVINDSGDLIYWTSTRAEDNTKAVVHTEFGEFEDNLLNCGFSIRMVMDAE